ncbi:hypothetical protein LCGC14_1836060 [marine sediment metagenome]|uniref:Uncharacterized protein n=1 Tax=marine sediment metagenome TaxID=412755 RepID=A0A0F9GEW4_9ZZZZ
MRMPWGYILGWSVVAGLILYWAMIKLTPKKGFFVVGERTVVKCNNCRLVQVKRENMRCRQCGNRGGVQ